MHGRAVRACVLFILLALVLLAGLGNHDLWAPDEPRYAQVAREMLAGGDWLLPQVNQRIYTDKPPGWFWCRHPQPSAVDRGPALDGANRYALGQHPIRRAA